MGRNVLRTQFACLAEAYLNGEGEVNRAKSFVENNIRLLRRTTQVFSIVAILALLLTGQIGIELETKSLVFFGNHIWPHEIALILLGLASPFVVLAGFALVFGRAFCGWFCPQTTLSELANVAQRLITGSRSQGVFRRAGVIVAVAFLALGMAIVGGFAVMSLFVPPKILLGVLSGHASTSLLKSITIVSFLLLVDVVLFRHTFCEWICVIGWWQRAFAGRGALRVAFAIKRARECSRCSDCKTACFMRIEPRRRDLPRTCLNCGECIVACKRKMAAVAAEGLIRYGFGDANGAGRVRTGAAGLPTVARVGGFAMLLLVVASLFSWSMLSRSPVQIKVRQANSFPLELANGQAEGAYIVDLFNTGKSDLLVRLQQTGLPEEAVVIAPNPVVALPNERVSASLTFRVDPRYLHPGRNAFVVTAEDVAGSAPKVSERVVFGIPIVPSVDSQVSLAEGWRSTRRDFR